MTGIRIIDADNPCRFHASGCGQGNIAFLISVQMTANTVLLKDGNDVTHEVHRLCGTSAHWNRNDDEGRREHQPFGCWDENHRVTLFFM